MANRKVHEGCDYCNKHKYFNDDDMAAIHICQDYKGDTVLRTATGEIEINFCPFCGRPIDKLSLKIFTIQELKDIVKPICRKYNVRKATLFGSYAKGNARPESDVDLMINSDLGMMKIMSFAVDVEKSLGGRELDIYDERELKPRSFLYDEVKDFGVVLYDNK